MDKHRLNKHFQRLAIDYLYHLGLDSTMDLTQGFGAIHNVIFTRSPSTAKILSQKLASSLFKIPQALVQCPTIAKDERYHMYKLPHTIIISHGIGAPSLLICLNEITKLLIHAGVSAVNFLRVGPADGLGVDVNQLIIAHEALSPQLQPQWQNIEFGTEQIYPTQLAPQLLQTITQLNPQANFIHGKILSSNNFYAGLGRVNGAIAPNFSPQERAAYFSRAAAAGVKAMDLESTCFSAFCRNFNIPAAMLAYCIADRLHDQEQEPGFKEEELANLDSPKWLDSKSTAATTLDKVSEIILTILNASTKS
jgi:uridine phosphorylase